MQRPILALPIFLLLLLTLILSGCGTLTQTASDSQSGRAQQLEALGDYAGAAQAYQRLAATARPPLRQDYELRAAAAALRAGNLTQARALVDGIDAGLISIKLLPSKQLLDAEIALSEGRPERTLAATQRLVQSALPAAVQEQAHLLRAEAYVLLDDQLASVNERILLDPFLTDPVAVNDNQTAIVQSLARLPSSALQQNSVKASPLLSGWAELVLIARASVQSPAQLDARLMEWRQRYPRHPATESLLVSLADARQFLEPQGQGVTGYPQRIALLLPITGSLANVGQAVSAAFFGAAKAQNEPRPDIRVYDVSASTPEGLVNRALQVYQQAVQEGAEFVVGPLQKDAVKALFTLGPLPVPTLALNYNDPGQGAPTNLYQFGLAPEDEARQVAERVSRDGHARALVLVPEGDRGARVLKAFRDQLAQLGGTVIDSQTYAPKQVDFSAPVRQLLQFGEGGDPDSGRAQRRQDADHVFIMATPAQGRSIAPMFPFFNAAELPVYATSEIYAAKPNRGMDNDLEGINFVDMPWVLADTIPQQSLRQSLANEADSFSQLKRIFALGVDAYHIIPHLQRLHDSPDARFEGTTGNLSLDEQNRVHRALLWARFRDGSALRLDTDNGADRSAAP